MFLGPAHNVGCKVASCNSNHNTQVDQQWMSCEFKEELRVPQRYLINLKLTSILTIPYDAQFILPAFSR